MKHFFGCRLLMATCLFFALVVAPGAWAQTTYFEPLSSSQARVSLPAAQNIQKYVAYQLKESDLRGYLAKAPLEFSGRGTALSLDIPLPNGTVETFAMSESPILAPAIASRHPEIKTYSGTGTIHKNYTIRLSFTANGFDAIILGVGGDAVYYTKASNDRASRVYLTYFARDVKKPENVKTTGSFGKCGSIDPAIPGVGTQGGRKGAALNNTGTTLRTFRLAIATTSKFTEKRGGTVTAAFSSVVSYVNRMNAVYRTELSVAFTLVSDTKIIYGGSNGDVNPNADPYTNNDTGKSSDENQINIDKEIGTANYDVGHVLGYSGGSGEGVAVSPSVCINDRKANGTSNVGNTSYGTIDSGTQYAPVFDDQLLCHEIGHQFGMTHSYHSSVSICSTRSAATSVEPGSGTTIMSYGYTCSDGTGNDNYEASFQPFLNFHTANYTQAANYINTLTCFKATALTNAIPVIGAFPVATTIPKSTPFALTGAATDTDDNTLNYSWEGTNIGLFIPNPTTLDNTKFPPFFRSYPPVSTGTRTFPRLSAILDGTNKAKGDKLPSEGIATTHRLTVRDNVGGLTYQEVTVTIDGESGPFLVTNDLSGSLPGSSKQTINWDVAKTTAAPVSCANVDILLSTDGGLTFPTTLLANTPNDGNQAVTLPAVLTSTARIKVAGTNTIFFDISNANFSIVAPVVPVVSLTAPDASASESTTNPGQGVGVMVAKHSGAGRLGTPGVDPASLHFERNNTVGTLVVKYSLGGTATNGDDYVGLPGSLTFADGESTVDVPVTPIDDEEVEGDEDVIVTLVDEAAYDPDPTNTSSKITIKEDDVAPAPLSITAVTTVSCQTLTAGLRRVSFTPQYAGLTGQPVSFSVANELVPTTNPGPYTLDLYTDNPAITLKATQMGTAGEASFVYNWLASCGAPVVVVPPVVPPTMSPLSITGVTTVSCMTTTAGQRQVNFTPQYAGANGQPITFSVANELAPTTSAGPYTLNLYTDNPAITLNATQMGTTGEASFVYNWLAACGTPVVVVPPVVVPPTVMPFAIAGVTTVNCTMMSTGLRTVSFSPQYAGTNGQPISFSVVNELVPTTAAGPYTLNLYTDNPTITLKAVQQGTAGEVSFAYNWLTACTASAAKRVGVSASAESVLDVRVIGNPVQNGQVRVEVRGAGGQPLRIQLTDMRGQVIGSHTVEQAGPVEQRSFEIGRQAPGLLLLRASTPSQSQTTKVLRD